MKGLVLSSLWSVAITSMIDQIVADNKHEWFKSATKSIIALILGILTEIAL